MDHSVLNTFDIRTFINQSINDNTSDVIVEKTVDLSINAKYLATMMCTPSNLEELATGFIYNEGLINSFSEVNLVDICHDASQIDVWLNHSIEIPDRWQRTSGCSGGSTSIFLNKSDFQKPLAFKIKPEVITRLIDLLLKNQSLYNQSGGVHSSALSDGENLLVVMEDIGRHNTLDKISGRCLMLTGFPAPGILISTGRISSEMLQKTSRIGASIIISRTSPSSLAIDFAREMGICIIGYARKDRFKIYSHPEFVEI